MGECGEDVGVGGSIVGCEPVGERGCGGSGFIGEAEDGDGGGVGHGGLWIRDMRYHSVWGRLL